MPGLYFGLVTIINAFRKLSHPFSIYITDSLGGSFKEYMKDEDMSLRIRELKSGLDEESLKTIDTVIKRVQHYPDESNKKRIRRSDEIVGGLLPVETAGFRRIMDKELENQRKILKFPATHIGESVFYFHHGLRLMPAGVLKYIKGKDFIDAGAFTGDSALALRQYDYSRIFSIEMSEKSISSYKTNMSANKVHPDKYKIINAAIASNDQEPPVKINDTGSSGFSLLRRTGKYDEITVVRKSIDLITEENNISPAFIKVDIEGYGMDFIKGAKRTLTNFRPVLSIAIYHNPIEFFELKPLLEDMLHGYNFMVRKLASGTENNLVHSEVILLGYPAELVKSNEEDIS